MIPDVEPRSPAAAVRDVVGSVRTVPLERPVLRPSRPSHVWYASYGSNMCRERFSHYLVGGTPRGAARCYEGARDPSLPGPGEDVPLLLPGSLFFALTSTVWSGGMAFLDPDPAPGAGPALGRAYRLSSEQFDDVAAQENRLPVGAASDDLAALLSGRPPAPPRGAYGRLVHLGDLAGEPVVTFTSPGSSRLAVAGRAVASWMVASPPFTLNRPSLPYLSMLAAGLRETFDLDTASLVSYLCAAPGGGSWSPDVLTAALEG